MFKRSRRAAEVLPQHGPDNLGPRCEDVAQPDSILFSDGDGRWCVAVDVTMDNGPLIYTRKSAWMTSEDAALKTMLQLATSDCKEV